MPALNHSGPMPFLPPNQQHQSTEGVILFTPGYQKSEIPHVEQTCGGIINKLLFHIHCLLDSLQ